MRATGGAVRAVGCIASACVLLFVSGAGAQVSPEEHAKHHPGAAGTAMPGTPGATSPMGTMPGASGSAGMGGMMEGMGEMMKGMHGAPPPKQLYPALIELPELTPEQRAEVEQQAAERMHSGTALMSQALDALNGGTQSGDYAPMHEAITKLNEGAAQLESGIAARRALAEGRAPREVALAWFKREMALSPPAVAHGGTRFWGMTPFHTFVMAALALFAAAMIAMYFFKMQRAASLLQSLTGGGIAASPRPSPSASRTAAVSLEARPIAAAPSPTATEPKRWSGKLRVAQIFDETPTVKTFRLMNPVGGALPFSYLPGQFLTLAVLLDGEVVKRSYTIASSPTQQDFVEITVRHADRGEVSGFLHERVKADDLLELSAPFGSFIFTGRECRCILLIGGGVGITPLMSVLRYLTDRSWPGDIYLLHSIAKLDEFIFREELEYLARRHPNVRMVVTVSHPEGSDWKGPTGRITKELIAQSVPDLASRYVHLCGPVPMMEATKKMLAELGVTPERIKTEAFGPALGKPEPAAPPAPELARATAEETAKRIALPTVTFAASNKSAPLPPDKTILEVADEIGVEIDNSCRVGTCGTCRVKCVAGHVSMAVEDGLEPGDKEQGIILACQAKATANVVIEA